MKHLAGLGGGIVVPGRPRGHPIDAVRRVVTLHVGGPAAEDPQRDAEVPVRFDIIVGLVDPADDLLGSVAIVERIGDYIEQEAVA